MAVTNIYWVRHAEPDYSIEDDRGRPLSEQGLKDTAFVLDVIKNKGIDCIFSSPYLRSMETIQSTSDFLRLPIVTDERLRERRGGVKGQGLKRYPERWKAENWQDEWGEPLNEVQERNIEFLTEILNNYGGSNILIGTHGTALATIIGYFYPENAYEEFVKMMYWMPNILKMTFDGTKLLKMEEVAHIEKGRRVIGKDK